MKKNSGKIAKSMIKYGLSIVVCTVVGGLLFPAYDGSSISQYEEPWYWIAALIVSFVTHICVLYFDKINPRKMYYCMGIFTAVVFPFCTIAFIVAFVCAAFLENTTVSVLLMILTVAVYLFLIYALLHRGVAIYQCGKIRIFKFCIKTYRTNLIDDCRLEYRGRKCTVHIIVDGKDHTFRTSAFFTKQLEQELKLHTKTYEQQLLDSIRKKK